MVRGPQSIRHAAVRLLIAQHPGAYAAHFGPTIMVDRTTRPDLVNTRGEVRIDVTQVSILATGEAIFLLATTQQPGILKTGTRS